MEPQLPLSQLGIPLFDPHGAHASLDGHMYLHR